MDNFRQRGRRGRAALAVTLLAVWLVHRPLLGQDTASPTLPGGAVAPQDAAFFVAADQPQRRWEMIRQHHAFRLLCSLPWVDGAVQAWSEAWQDSNDSVARTLRRWWSAPAQDSLRNVVSVSWGQKWFAFGNAHCGPWIQFLVRLPYHVLQSRLKAESSGAKMVDVLVRQIIVELDRASGELHLPTIVMGGPLHGESEPLLTSALNQMQAQWSALAESPWRGALERQQNAQRDVLFWTLDGSQLPWDAIQQQLSLAVDRSGPFHDSSEAQQALERLIERCRQGRWHVSLGRWSDQFLLVLGPPAWEPPSRSWEQNPRWLAVQDRLSSSDDLVSMCYYDWESMGLGDARRRMLHDAIECALLSIRSSSLAPAMMSDIETKLRHWCASTEVLFRRQIASLHYVLAYQDHWEGASHRWSESEEPPETLDGPLQLTQHLGATAWGWAVWKHALDSAHYQPLAQLAALLYDAFHRIGGQPLDNNERAALLQMRLAIEPFFKSMDHATRAHLLSGLAHGEAAWVGSVAYSTRQPWAGMPQSDRDLPMPSLTAELTLTDPIAYRRAWSTYFSALKRCWTALHEHFPRDVGEELTLPSEIREDATAVFSWDWPASWETDRRWRPHAMLRDDLLVAGFFPDVSRAYLTLQEPPSAAMLPAPLTAHLQAAGVWNGPLAADWMRAWVRYLQDNGALDAQSCWPDAVDLVESLGRLGWVRFQEDGRSVTQWRWLMQ